VDACATVACSTGNAVAIAQADADERLEHQPRALPRTRPADPGRFARLAVLARRVRSHRSGGTQAGFRV
jgi:hypothetical protein